MITKNRIEWCIKETGGVSMRQAYLISDVSYPTFRKWAKRYGLWKPNQAGRGIPKRKRIRLDSPIDFDLKSWEDVLKEMKMK